MPLDTIINDARDQERGAWLDLADPIEGKPVGIRLCIAGPDSETARRARLTLADELAAVADPHGRVNAEARERCRKAALAAVVLRWEAQEDGQPVPFTTANVLRLLSVLWAEEQIDAFAADRSNFKPGA